MECPAEVAHPDRPSPLDGVAQLRWVEPLDPRPQADIGIDRLLCLHADEVLEDIECGAIDALQEQLSGEKCPVERPPRQDPFSRCARGHACRARAKVWSVSAENNTNVTASSVSGCSAIHASTVWSATPAARSTG